MAGGGRLRLGLGIGWNRVEYEALGQSFGDRAARLEEQVHLLRRLWTEESVTFDGRFHTVNAAGLAPRPAAAASRSGSAPWPHRPCNGSGGWPTAGSPRSDRAPASKRRSRSSPRPLETPAATRPPSGSKARSSRSTDPDRAGHHADRWRLAGASHLSVNTMAAGYRTVDDHILALARLADALGVRRNDDRSGTA